MYEHVREVSTGLVLSLVATTIAGIVAWVDPWNNGIPWVNWLVISTVMIFAVAIVTASCASAKSDEDFFSPVFGILFMWTLLAAPIVLMLTEMTTAIKPNYRSLAWSAFGLPMGTFIITAMIQYVVGARAVHGSNRSNHLNRVE